MKRIWNILFILLIIAFVANRLKITNWLTNDKEHFPLQQNYRLNEVMKLLDKPHEERMFHNLSEQYQKMLEREGLSNFKHKYDTSDLKNKLNSITK